LAYGVRDGGEDEVVVRVLDVERQVDLTDRLPKGRYYDVRLTPDGAGFYYSQHTDDGPRVFYHAMDTDPADDQELFGRAYGPEKGIGIELSDDGNFLVITVWHGSASKVEIYYQDVGIGGEILPIVNDIDAKFEAHVGGQHVFMLTNWEAPAGRIVAVDLIDPDRANWREIVPETHAIIRDYAVAGGKIFVDFLDNVISSAKVFETSGELAATLELPAPGSVRRIRGQWHGEEVFFSFSSFHIPTTIYHYDVTEDKQDVWAKVDVPIDGENFQVKQVWYDSRDYTRVPMFIVHPKDLKLDGSNPTLLTGYGGFRGSMTPRFSPQAALWVMNGGIYAIPSLRGGGEFGEEWHRAGMLENKQNTFDDFIAAAEYLIEHNYTSPERLAISGTSNGGLLVGAALTQRPDLFQAVVCGYPLLDMVRYHRFLVARFWIPEYGSAEDPEQFPYIHAYSPYHRVTQGAEYPAVMLVTGDADTRVDPFHARKMAARLQAATAGDRPIILQYDTRAGHSGGKPLTKRIDDLTDRFLFLFWQLGMKP
jgi:prolyl oligopeptidase